MDFLVFKNAVERERICFKNLLRTITYNILALLGMH